MSAELTYEDAQKAMDTVILKYGNYISDDLKKHSAYTVFQFCDPVRYRLMFTQAYTRVFKNANRVLIPQVITHEQVPAFVMPELGARVVSRRIIVGNRACNAGSNTTIGTLIHEYIHYVSHKNFYPDYYNSGDEYAPFFVEGATEYFTRETKHTAAVCRKNYQKHYKITSKWVRNDKGNRDKLLKYLFQGVKFDAHTIDLNNKIIKKKK